MPIGSSLFDYANAFARKAADLVQPFFRKQKEEIQNEFERAQAGTADPAHPELSALDHVALSAQIAGQVQSGNIESASKDQIPGTVGPDAVPVAEKSGLGALSAASESGVSDEHEQSLRPGSPTEFEEALNAAGNRAPELGNLLHTWMQADPKTLTGLQNFLEVEFSHYSADPRTFQAFQLISMLREARELLEEQKLRDSSESAQVSGSTEEAERALFGASLMGYAYHLLRRKGMKDRAGVRFNPEAMENLEGSELSLCLDEVLDYLRKAEVGLQRAMAQGVDNRRMRLLIHKVLDVCADIIQMQRELSAKARNIPA